MHTSTELLDGDTQAITSDGEHDRFKHFVLKSPLTEAYVLGTPVTALCGKIWVPSRNPDRYPMCPECKRLYDMGPEERAQEWARRMENSE